MLKNFLIKLWDVFPFLHGVITLQLNYTPKVKPSKTPTKSEFHLAYLVLFCSFYSFCHIKNIPLYPCLIPNSHHQPSTINHQPSHQPSTIIHPIIHHPSINHHPSTINHQSINHQPSTINHQLTHQPSTTLLNPKGKSKESQRKVKGKYN
jgi:hypothetical protein